MKQEQSDYPNQSLDDFQPTQAAYSEAQHQHKIGGQPNDPSTFSLTDITGDVDHIQSSLDNIRDLMFEHIPEGSSLDDLFGEDNGLLSTLLHTDNPLLESLHDQKLMSSKWRRRFFYLNENGYLDEQPTDSTTTTTSQSVPNVNNQLRQQLGVVLLEEQQQTINQLEREKSALEDKVHLLEQQQTSERK